MLLQKGRGSKCHQISNVRGRGATARFKCQVRASLAAKRLVVEEGAQMVRMVDVQGLVA